MATGPIARSFAQECLGSRPKQRLEFKRCPNRSPLSAVEVDRKEFDLLLEIETIDLPDRGGLPMDNELTVSRFFWSLAFFCAVFCLALAVLTIL